MRLVRNFDVVAAIVLLSSAAPVLAQAEGGLVEQAAAAREAGDFSEAVTLLEQARQASPDDPEILRLLGTSYAFDKRFDRALPVLERAHSLAPENADISAALARAYLWSGRLKQGRGVARGMQDADPLNSEAANILRQIDEARTARRGKSGVHLNQTVADVSLSYGHKTWWETAAGVYVAVDSRSTVSAEVQRSDRSFATDFTMSSRIDHRFSPDVSAYLAVTATADADFKEEWSIRAGTQLAISPAVSFVLDGRHAHYAAVDSQSLGTGVRVRKGPVAATVKMTNLWNSDGFYANGWSLRLDATLPGEALLYAGAATYPDTEAGVTRRVRAVFAGGTVPLDDRLRLRAGAEYERRTATYTRKGVTIGLDWRF